MIDSLISWSVVRCMVLMDFIVLISVIDLVDMKAFYWENEADITSIREAEIPFMIKETAGSLLQFCFRFTSVEQFMGGFSVFFSCGHPLLLP